MAIIPNNRNKIVFSLIFCCHLNVHNSNYAEFILGCDRLNKELWSGWHQKSIHAFSTKNPENNPFLADLRTFYHV